MNVFLRLGQKLQSRLMHHIVRDPVCLSIMLHSLRDGEEGGETVVFRQPPSLVSPRLRRLIERHAADEARHLGMLERAISGLGDVGVGAEHAQVLEIVEDLAGDVFDQDMDQPENLARAFWLVHALERRLAGFLAHVEAHLAPVDPELARTFAEIRADEVKHITWCQVVTWELQRGQREAWEAMRDEMVALEARSFGRVQASNLASMLQVGLRALPWPERALWTAAAAVLRWADLPLPVADPQGVLEGTAWWPREERPLAA